MPAPVPLLALLLTAVAALAFGVAAPASAGSLDGATLELDATQIGSGWDAFREIICGQNGKIYALYNDGRLRIYIDRTRNGTASWYYKTVADGWTTSKYARITCGVDGRIYAVKPNGDVMVEHHTSFNTAVNWSATSNQTRITNNWHAWRHVFGGHDGVIYAVSSADNLHYYRDLNRDGTPNWGTNNGARIGTGWTFAHVFGGWRGLIYTVDANGTMKIYRDLVRDGTNRSGSGKWDVVTITTRTFTGYDKFFGGEDGVVYARTTTGKLHIFKFRFPMLDSAGVPEGDVGAGFTLANGRLTAPGGAFSIVGTFGAQAAPGKFAVGGSVVIETPDGGSWGLDNASLQVDVSTDRPFISGTAQVSLPEVGLLRGIVSVTGKASAQISIGFGGSFEVSLGDGADERQFPTDPGKFYMYASFQGEARARIVPFNNHELVFGHGTKMLFEPTQPILYADHDLAKQMLEMLGIRGWQKPLIGFSLGPAIRHTLANPLPKLDHTGTETVAADANILLKGAVTIPLKAATLNFDGAMFVDLDVDGDGTLCLAGGTEASDFGFGGDLHGTLSIAVKGVDIPIELGQVSMMYAAGHYRMNGYTGKPNYFEGTALAAWNTGTASQRLLCDITDSDYWVQTGYSTFSIAGWTLGDASVTLTPPQMAIAGEINLAPGSQGGKVNVTGAFVYATGQATLQGTGALTLAGHNLSNGTATLNVAGVWSGSPTASATVRGSLAMLGTNAALSGNVASNGTFSLTGSATASVTVSNVTVPLSSMNVTFTNTAGVRFTGGAGYAGVTFSVSGTWVSNSNWSFAGTKSVNVNRSVTLTQDNPEPIPDISVTSTLNVTGTARLSVTQSVLTAQLTGGRAKGSFGVLGSPDVPIPTANISTSGKITFTILGIKVTVDIL